MKRIVITEKGRQVCEMTRSEKDSLEAALLADIPQEELDVFLRVCGKLGDNAQNIS